MGRNERLWKEWDEIRRVRERGWRKVELLERHNDSSSVGDDADKRD